jgi:hypothetical protein
MEMREACAIVQAYADLHTEGECIEACALIEDEGSAEQREAAELFMSVYP